MVNDSGIGSLLDRSLGNPLSRIFGIPLALSAAVFTTSAEWKLEITLTDEVLVQQVLFLFLREVKLDWGQIAYAHFPPLAGGAAFGSTGFPTHFRSAGLTSHLGIGIGRVRYLRRYVDSLVTCYLL